MKPSKSERKAFPLNIIIMLLLITGLCVSSPSPAAQLIPLSHAKIMNCTKSSTTRINGDNEHEFVFNYDYPIIDSTLLCPGKYVVTLSFWLTTGGCYGNCAFTLYIKAGSTRVGNVINLRGDASDNPEWSAFNGPYQVSYAYDPAWGTIELSFDPNSNKMAIHSDDSHPSVLTISPIDPTQ